MPSLSVVVTTYNITEAAERLGVSRVTVWRAIRDGKLVSATRPGRSAVITADNLLDYVLQHQRGRGIPSA